MHRIRAVALLGVERRVQQQTRHADDAVHRRAQFMAHVGQEFALGTVRRLSGFVRGHQLAGAFLHHALQSLIIGRQLVVERRAFESASAIAQENGQQLLVRIRRLIQTDRCDAKKHSNDPGAGGESVEDDLRSGAGAGWHLHRCIALDRPGEDAIGDLRVHLFVQPRSSASGFGVDQAEAESVGFHQEKGGLLEVGQATQHRSRRGDDGLGRCFGGPLRAKGPERRDHVEGIKEPLGIRSEPARHRIHAASRAMTCTAVS